MRNRRLITIIVLLLLITITLVIDPVKTYAYLTHPGTGTKKLTATPQTTQIKIADEISLGSAQGLSPKDIINVPIGGKFKLTDVDLISVIKGNETYPVDIIFGTDNINIAPKEPLILGTFDIEILLTDGGIYNYKISTTNIEYISTKNSALENSTLFKVYPTENNKQFIYPYLISIPNGLNKGSLKQTMIVETANVGQVGDENLQEILQMPRVLNNGVIGQMVATKMNSIFMMPLLPRGVDAEGNNNWALYQHSLDRDTLVKNDKEKIAIDEQVYAMIKDAQNMLNTKGMPVDSKVFMIGFSASGVFANRFSLLHPDIVQATAFQNSTPTVPLNEYNGLKLTFPVGISDVKEIRGTAVDVEAYKKIKQYIYLADKDTNDGVGMWDGYDDRERDEVYNALGKNMFPDRWNTIQKIYKNLNMPVQTVTYKDVDHNITDSMIKDVSEFLKQNSGETFNRITPTNGY